MKNIGVLGDFVKTKRLLDRLKLKNAEEINVINLNNAESGFIAATDAVILNKNYNRFNLKAISENTAVILNSDSFFRANGSFVNAHRLITTGYSSKSTLTISSVSITEVYSFLCCLQRSIEAFNGEKIGEYEFKVNTDSEDISLLLTVIATGLYFNVENIKLNKFFL